MAKDIDKIDDVTSTSDEVYKYGVSEITDGVITFFSTDRVWMNGEKVWIDQKPQLLKDKLLSLILKKAAHSESTVEIHAFNRHIVPLLQVVDRIRSDLKFEREEITRLRRVITLQKKNYDEEVDDETYDRIIPGLSVTLHMDPSVWSFEFRRTLASLYGIPDTE